MDRDIPGKSNDAQFMSFQDFSPINRSGGGQAELDLGSPSQQQNFGYLGGDSSGIGMMQDLQGMPHIKDDENVPRNFWTIEYYQKYFNVDTRDVVERLKRSMVPHGVDNYLISHIRPNPDLYGPFWVCVTLIFSIAISGNIANYLHTANNGSYHWRYDFHLVSIAAICIFLYAWLLPLVLWLSLKWTASDSSGEDELIEPNRSPGLLELICLYGYSLAIYIPTSVLWTIQISWLQWSLVGIATCLSGGVLLRSLQPLISGKRKALFIAAILGMHVLLGAGFMLSFFHNPAKNAVPVPDAGSTTPNSTEVVTKVVAKVVTKVAAAVVNLNASTPKA